MMLSDPFCIRLIVLAPLEIIWWKSNGMDQLFSNWKGVAKDFQGDLEIFQKSRWWRGGGSRHQKLSRGPSTSNSQNCFLN